MFELALMNLVRLSEVLSWLAIGAVVLAEEGVLGPIWPLAIGFAWIFARLSGAPVIADAYAYLCVSLLLCLVVVAYATLSSADSLSSVLRLKSGPGLSVALLGLGYGVAVASIVCLVMMRRRPRELDPQLEKMLEEVDATVFGTNTKRATNPILVVILLAVAACLTYLLFR